MNNKEKYLPGLFILIIVFIAWLVKPVYASEMYFEFGNPAFSGDGYSSHVLSVDQLQTRKSIDFVKNDKNKEGKK